MPVSAIVLSRSIRTQQKAALRVARSCLLPSAYQVHYRRDGEPNWQFASSVEAGVPLSPISLPVLAPGDYDVRVSACGFAWNRHEYASRARFRVSPSGTELALPAVSDLTAVLEGSSVVLSWLWKPQLGVQSPTGFAIWISQTATVDTFAPPALFVSVDGNRRHYARLPSGSVRFALVAARKDGQVGPMAIVELPKSSAATLTPGDQFAKPFTYHRTTAM